ncbi:MAG: hypothetical protein GX640_04025 [Fibrobacter sp.]|nr:hypothetical protein [Fibrobacter sp.]
MDIWTIDSLQRCLNNSENYTDTQKMKLIEFLNQNFKPSVYNEHLQKRRAALRNMTNSKSALQNAAQHYPQTVNWKDINPSTDSLKGFALVFTAGGEGERLRLSLLKKGIPASMLEDFTKATFPLPDFFDNFGALQTNLAMVASFCNTIRMDIPVIVTTGPQGTITAGVIPEILRKNNNFGLKHVLVIAQDERLHLTIDEKIACTEISGELRPLTQPDETGGPLMKLKQIPDTSGISALDWVEELGCNKLIVVQATALYDLRLLPIMAQALGNHDCLGVGILRTEFPPKDPFGTFVTITRGDKPETLILEQDVRNDETRTIKDQSGQFYLPFNTGFYAFGTELLKNNNLPDFATPPKEILPELPRSPKIGYAATDLLPLASNPVILTIEQDMFAVLKTAEDLEQLSILGKKFGLDKICRTMEKR